MAAAFFALFKGDNLKTTLIAIAAMLLALFVCGSLAYAGYAWASRGEEKRIAEVKDAMREVFDQEKADLINTFRDADRIDALVAEIKQAIEGQAGTLKAEMKTLRDKFPEVYTVKLPKEGKAQWSRSRELYNDAARSRPQ